MSVTQPVKDLLFIIERQAKQMDELMQINRRIISENKEIMKIIGFTLNSSNKNTTKVTDPKESIFEQFKRKYNEIKSDSRKIRNRIDIIDKFDDRIKIIEGDIAFLIKHILFIKKKSLLEIRFNKTAYAHWVCNCEQVNSEQRTKCISCGSIRK